MSLFALACGEDPSPTQPEQGVKPSPEFGIINPENGAGQCMGDDAKSLPFPTPGSLVSGFSSTTDPNAFVCQANEVYIATADVTQVFDPDANGGAGAFVAFDEENPPHCAEGDDITFKMTAHLAQSAESERQDIGVWIATDGGNAKTGDCNHYNLPAGAAGTTNDDGDQCAGLAEGGTTAVDLGTLTVPCNPDPVTNNLAVGSCIGWKVPADDQECSDDSDGNGTDEQSTDFRAGTLPTNKTKCNCEPFIVPIIVDKSATIEVKKTCSAGTTGTFDLLIDGSNAFGNDKSCGGTTGAQTVNAGTSQSPGALHNVGENDFTTANYTSTYSCTRDPAGAAGPTVFTSGTGTSVSDFTVNPDDAIVCTFNNAGLGTIIIQKETDPDAASGSFGFTRSFGAGFSLSDGGSTTFSNVPVGSKTVTETDPTPGFDLYDLQCDDANSTENVGTRTATINLETGETVTCTFYNRKRGKVTVTKTENGGLPLSRAWEFQIRYGASLASSGTVIAAGSANLTTGVVSFACSPNPNSKCANDGSSVAQIVPGDYQFCEINMPAGYANDIAGFTPDGEIPEGSDNGNECINFTLDAGETQTFTVDNTPPPGGDARTIGYWKNHSCQAPGNQADALTPELPVTVATGDADAFTYVLNSCADAVKLLDKRDRVNGKKKASDAAYNLAAQLIAALLNQNSGAEVCAAAATAITSAQLLLDQISFNGTGNYLTKPSVPNYAQANTLAATLDSYNNNTLCP